MIEEGLVFPELGVIIDGEDILQMAVLEQQKQREDDRQPYDTTGKVLGEADAEGATGELDQRMDQVRKVASQEYEGLPGIEEGKGRDGKRRGDVVRAGSPSRCATFYTVLNIGYTQLTDDCLPTYLLR